MFKVNDRKYYLTSTICVVIGIGPHISTTSMARGKVSQPISSANRLNVVYVAFATKVTTCRQIYLEWLTLVSEILSYE